MATQEQIERLAELLRDCSPSQALTCMDQTQAGIGAVLHLLASAEGPLTAGRIAEATQVSTARTAVLLRKMEQKGLILRERDPGDARVSLARLSPRGIQVQAEARARLQALTGQLIDRIGMERLSDFLSTAREIQAILPNADPV